MPEDKLDPSSDSPSTRRSFWRELGSGARPVELRRLFEKDVSRALEVLTRDHRQDVEPKDGFDLFLYRVRLLFLGLTFKLSPARRLLFGISWVTLGLGLIDFEAEINQVSVSIDFSPFWFLISLLIVTFLLVLELVDRVQVRDEMAVARQLQRELLPGKVAVPGCIVSHSYRTANEVGGDFYDFMPLEDGRVALMIGDASGHGMAAGLLMATAKAALQLAIDLDPDPERVVELVNRSLVRTGDRRSFMTLFYAVLDPAEGEMEFVCAGHPFPLLRRRDGELLELGVGGLPLGLRAGLKVPAARERLGLGDVLLLYTDGLPEAVRGSEMEAFGFERLGTLMEREGTPERIHNRVMAAFDRYLDGESLIDDVSLVVLARRPSAATASEPPELPPVPPTIPPPPPP